MEITGFELELLAAIKLNKEFWATLENNGMVEVPTKRNANALVRKAARHPGHYMVTAA